MTEVRTSRFGKMTHEEALMEAETRETWLIEPVISAASTLVYGEAKIGKSFLMSAFVAALYSGEPFLGFDVPTDRDFSVAVCWTDDGGAADYSSQVQSVLPDDARPGIGYYSLPTMNRESWSELYEEVMADGHNVVVVDNMMQCLNGSVNHDEPVREFFEGLRLFTRSGVPAIIVGHSSDKAGPNGYKPDTPMGNALISQAVRWKCFVKRTRKGNLTLRFTGNYVEPFEMTLKHGVGARFDVVEVKTAEMIKAADQNAVQQREAKTFDDNRRMAKYVVANCQGLGVNAAAKKVAESGEFSAVEETVRSKLKTAGPVGKLLTRTGSGDATTWGL
jgi:hypothetical protein